MNPNAFVVVTCFPGEENKTKEFLNEIPQVKDSNFVKGAFDILVKIKTSSAYELREMLWKIRSFPSVRSTLTLNLDD